MMIYNQTQTKNKESQYYEFWKSNTINKNIPENLTYGQSLFLKESNNFQKDVFYYIQLYFLVYIFPKD